MVEDLCGRMLGEFVLCERIGDGGFGDVYRAEQPKLGREAVVKVPKLRLRGDGATLRRFMREAQLASRLDHPYAAHVYAFGTEEKDGLFWIAMEMVHGQTLDNWLRERDPLTLDQLVPFLERVAEVVQTAHDCGIVHRDLKPSNIMVIERAGQLLPKLLDFGIAKLLGALPDDSEIAYVDDDEPRPEIAYVDDDDPAIEAARPEDRPSPRTSPDRHPTTGPTVRGGGPFRSQGRRSSGAAASGSPPYMAPEQWNESAPGPSTDLYALGVIAYEALTGRRPFHAFTTDRYSELHRLAPVPPLGDGFPPALDRFFQRALAKRPEDRWSSALELAGALRTELEARMRTQVRTAARQWQDRGRPADLLWRGTTLAELERWLRQPGAPQLTGLETEFADASIAQSASIRRRATKVRRGIVALCVLGVLGAAEYYRVVQARSSDEVALQAEVEQGRAAVLHNESSEAQLHLMEAYRRGDRTPADQFMLARALQPRLAELARFESAKGRMWSATFSPDGTRILTADDTCARVWGAQTNQLLFTLPHGHAVYDAVYSADGTQIVTAGLDVVRIWDAASGAPARELHQQRDDGRATRYSIVAMPTDGRVVAAIDTAGEVVHVWEIATSALVVELQISGSAFPSLAFSSDGRWLAMSGGDDVRVFDTASWAQSPAIAARNVRGVAFDPTGPRLLTGGSDGAASIWEVPSGERVLHLRENGEPISSVAFSRNGKLVATAGRNGGEIWDTSQGAQLGRIDAFRVTVMSLEFDRTSTLVVAASDNGTVLVADALGMPLSTLEGTQKTVRTAHFDPNSLRVVGASWDGTARVWDATPPYRHWSSLPVAEGCGLAMSLEPDRRFIAVGCRDQVTRVWDTAHDRLLAELPGVTPPPGDFASAFPAVSADGDRAAIAIGNSVALYELPGGRLLRTIAHSAAVSTVAFASSGRDLISGAIDGSLLVTRDDGAPLVLPTATFGIDAARFVSNDKIVAVDAANRMRVYQASDRPALLADLEMPTRAGLLRPSQDALRLITVPTYTGNTAPAVLWDLERYRLIAKLEGVGQVLSAQFATGDRTIITTGNDGAVRLWDGETGERHQIYRANSRFFADATLSPDGAIIVAGANDGLLRFWDVASGRPLWILQAHRSHVVGVHFEGDDIVTRGFAGDVARWRLPKPELAIEQCSRSSVCAIVSR